MRELQLTHGMVALVDDADYERVADRKWHAHFQSKNSTPYARRSKTVNGRSVCVMLHREILSAPRGTVVDHINGNGLDCRRENMRLTTAAGNTCNRRKQPSPTTSRWKGVSWITRDRVWRAEIRANGRRAHLGDFRNERAAALAYDAAARRMHGAFACLNFPGPNEVGATNQPKVPRG